MERRSAQAVNRKSGAAEGGVPEGRLESRNETEAFPRRHVDEGREGPADGKEIENPRARNRPGIFVLPC